MDFGVACETAPGRCLYTVADLLCLPRTRRQPVYSSSLSGIPRRHVEHRLGQANFVPVQMIHAAQNRCRDGDDRTLLPRHKSPVPKRDSSFQVRHDISKFQATQQPCSLHLFSSLPRASQDSALTAEAVVSARSMMLPSPPYASRLASSSPTAAVTVASQSFVCFDPIDTRQSDY